MSKQGGDDTSCLLHRPCFSAAINKRNQLVPSVTVSHSAASFISSRQQQRQSQCTSTEPFRKVRGKRKSNHFVVSVDLATKNQRRVFSKRQWSNCTVFPSESYPWHCRRVQVFGFHVNERKCEKRASTRIWQFHWLHFENWCSEFKKKVKQNNTVLLRKSNNVERLTFIRFLFWRSKVQRQVFCGDLFSSQATVTNGIRFWKFSAEYFIKNDITTTRGKNPRISKQMNPRNVKRFFKTCQGKIFERLQAKCNCLMKQTAWGIWTII